jgi:uracil-DNA glycosylase
MKYLTKLASDCGTSWSPILVELCEKHDNIHKVFDDTNLQILPKPDQIFNAFKFFDIENTNVVNIGQDPYATPGDAMGLAFSVNSYERRMPPSLLNIFKEINNEYDFMRTDRNLTDWAESGVLLLNTALTVKEYCPGSHLKIWQPFTQDLINILSKKVKNIVYILWGAHAQSYEDLLDSENNLILKHSHPSPLSRKPFVGNNHFKLANDYLIKYNKTPINWSGKN